MTYGEFCAQSTFQTTRRALDHAVAIARWYDSTITAVHVFSPVPVPAYGPPPIALEPIVLTSADRERFLATTRQFIERESPQNIAFDAVIREGNAATEILECASSLKADLLVLGTHGRSGFERLLLESVTEKVLRKGTCPVLTVPPALPDAVPAAPGLFNEILCPVDFSDSSSSAVRRSSSRRASSMTCFQVEASKHPVPNSANPSALPSITQRMPAFPP